MEEPISQGTNRNIIIIGDSGCGKSTIASKLDPRIDPRKDKFGFFGIDSTESCYTEGPVDFRETAADSGRTEEETYCITVIDTISLESERFEREKIQNFFARNGIDQINLIIVVVKEGRITADEKDLLQSVELLFSANALRKTLAFIISHCEQYSTEVRESVVQSFNKFYSRLFPELKIPVDRIITTGFPSAEHYKDVIFRCFQDSIRNDAEKLKSLIVNAKESVDITTLFEVSKSLTISKVNEDLHRPFYQRLLCLIL